MEKMETTISGSRYRDLAVAVTMGFWGSRSKIIPTDSGPAFLKI